jgi:hypothetical protein
MTSTLSRANSAAISTKRSGRLSAQRYSIVAVRPSIQPSSRSRCTNAPVHDVHRSEFLAAVVAALEGCDEVTNDQLGRVLAETQLLYRGGPAGVDGT